MHFKISLYKKPSPNSTTAFWQHTAAGARSGGHQAPVLAPIQNPLYCIHTCTIHHEGSFCVRSFDAHPTATSNGTMLTPIWLILPSDGLTVHGPASSRGGTHQLFSSLAPCQEQGPTQKGQENPNKAGDTILKVLSNGNT